jgi:hypothetical protein
LRRSLTDPKEELNVSFTKSYEVTLKKFHSFVIRPVFTVSKDMSRLEIRLYLEFT